MKRYFIYIIMVVATLFAGCTTEDVNDSPEMIDVGNIEVTFSIDGEEVRSLDLTSVSHTIVVDVTLNNEGVYWTPVSSQEWCQIVEEEHRGSGSFTMVINANDSFEARERAEILFVAGEYSTPKLSVIHDGNVFVIDQVYTASTKAGGNATIHVSTIEGVEWSFEGNEWISAAIGSQSTTDGVTTTELNISWAENNGATRYGSLNLIKAGRTEAEGWFNIWQYGTDVNYDDEGYILLGAKDAEPLELRVPKQTVKDIVMPSWVSYELVENEDNTASYMLRFADNPSDAQHIRVTELSLSMLSGGADVALPVIKQEYYAMEGLLTGPGLALFAKTWNEGGDVSQWYIDGVPTIIDDMDLTEIKEWTPIGTAERPWTGEFNGNGKKLINFNASQPMFGHCKDATLKNIVFDETSKFVVKGSFDAPLYLAPLAAVIENTVVEGCTNSATVSLEASTQSTAAQIYLAGLVCQADAASVVRSSTNMGSVSVSAAVTTAADAEDAVRIGGIVGDNSGTIEDCFNNGNLAQKGTIHYTFFGGVAGRPRESSIIRNNLNAGTMTFAANRGAGDAGRYGYIGGIVGIAAGEISGNTNEGDITSTSTVKLVHIGGIAGVYNDTTSILKNNSQANASDLVATGAARYTYIGGLIGYVTVPLTLDFTVDTGTISGNASINGISDKYASGLTAVGGLIGYCSADSSVTIKSPTWDGKLSMDITANSETAAIGIGGIVGATESAITISGSTTTGSILSNAKGFTVKKLTSIGGVVGIAEDGVTITDSTNGATLSWPIQDTKANGAMSYIGGMVGLVRDGNAVVTNCHNRGTIKMAHYNNNAYTTAHTCNFTGGIVGAYGASTSFDDSCTLLVKDCTNIAKTNATRGGVGGIIGYSQNGTIDNCSFTEGSMADEYNAYCGGIASVIADSTIKNCTVKTTIAGQYTGSLDFRGGGIAAWVTGKSHIDNCSFFGTITIKALDEGGAAEYYGGIAGLVPDEETKISNCRYGGTLCGVEINADNFMEYLVMKPTVTNEQSPATVENCSYWNGK
ncbi:MAG: BACON domain-containing protein [Alistipes sp.]|nr:BACON domain-containing protein [Alistipes sp.]